MHTQLHLQKKYARLKERISRISFQHLSQQKQTRLHLRLHRYEQRLIQLGGAAVLLGISLPMVHGQFVEVTTIASPFINLPIDPAAPFGLSGVGSISSIPTFVDIDGDGDLDAFVGEFDGNINYFENTSTDSSIPAFSLVSTDGAFGLLDVGYRSIPTFVDIDGDGDLDEIGRASCRER